MFVIPGDSLSSPSGFAGMGQKRTKGMLHLADWYMAFVANPDFVKGVFNAAGRWPLIAAYTHCSRAADTVQFNAK